MSFTYGSWAVHAGSKVAENLETRMLVQWMRIHARVEVATKCGGRAEGQIPLEVLAGILRLAGYTVTRERA